MSAADWLSEFPPGWRELRADFLCNPYRVTVSPERYEGEMVAHYSIPQVQETGGPLIEPADDIDSTKLLISKSTLLVSKLNPRKRTICIAEPQDGLTTLASGEFVPIQSVHFDQRYGYYMWQSEKVTDRLSAIVQSATRSHQRVNPADILKLPWRWPYLEAQTRIAAFLDGKTAQIDGLIARKQALLERFAEKRQAIITGAVTKGLDPAVPMKHSGIEWLGQIPAHWGIIPLKWQCSIRSGQVDPTEPPYDEMTLVAPDHIESGTGRLLARQTATEQAAISGKYLCRQEDVLYSKIRPALRKVALSEGICLCSADMYSIASGIGFNREYLFYFLLTDAFTAYAELASMRVAMPKVNREALGSFPLPKPPVEEQLAIIDFIRDELRDLDRITVSIDESVLRLTEYRDALITAAVTGQIEGLR